MLKCKDLTVGYKDGPVAGNINFELHHGDYLFILGENGSGKTTLMKTMLGLIKPLDGEIIRSGQLKNGAVGYLPQQLQVQRDFPASVWEVVLSGNIGKPQRGPFFGADQKALALENMKRMGIAELATKPYKNLSGGQQRRTLLARALCGAGEMLLLDEPTAGLDEASEKEMYQYIDGLKQEGMTIIMISHDREASLKYASHVLRIDHGETAFYNIEEFKKSLAQEARSEKGVMASE